VPAVPAKMVAELRKMADPDEGWQYGDGLPMAEDAMAILHALSAAPQPAQQVAHKPLFAEMIAEHPGLREELLLQDAQQEPAQK